MRKSNEENLCLVGLIFFYYYYFSIYVVKNHFNWICSLILSSTQSTIESKRVYTLFDFWLSVYYFFNSLPNFQQISFVCGKILVKMVYFTYFDNIVKKISILFKKSVQLMFSFLTFCPTVFFCMCCFYYWLMLVYLSLTMAWAILLKTFSLMVHVYQWWT